MVDTKRLVRIIDKHLNKWQRQIDSDIRADYEKENRLMAKSSLAAAFLAKENGSVAERAEMARKFPALMTATPTEILTALNSVTAADVEAALTGNSNGHKPAATVADVPVKRRGRPPGTGKKVAAKPAKAAPIADDDEEAEEETPAPKRRGRPPGSGKKLKAKRGRPPKARAVEVEEDDDEEEVSAPAPKRRGRPPGKSNVAPAAKVKAKKSKVVEEDEDEPEDEIDALMVDEDEEEDDESEEEEDESEEDEDED